MAASKFSRFLLNAFVKRDMFLLDTNHLKELAYPTPLGERLRGRLLQSGAQVFTTVITSPSNGITDSFVIHDT